MTDSVITKDMIYMYAMPTVAVASKLDKLVILSEVMVSDAAVSRQARRKFCRRRAALRLHVLATCSGDDWIVAVQCTVASSSFVQLTQTHFTNRRSYALRPRRHTNWSHRPHLPIVSLAMLR